MPRPLTGTGARSRALPLLLAGGTAAYALPWYAVMVLPELSPAWLSCSGGVDLEYVGFAIVVAFVGVWVTGVMALGRSRRLAAVDPPA